MTVPTVVALYLPQYHPVPENDEWWGKGFTEWTNVTKAKPLFRGHHQPNLPADLGFYDLRVPEVRQAQADLARAYGIDGFVYYHYWFTGRRMLQRTAERWRSAAMQAGLGDLYLVRVESFQRDVDPVSIGFDAAVEFAPDWRHANARYFGRRHRLLAKLGLFPKGYLEHNFCEYPELVASMQALPPAPYRRIRCVTPGFDNSARRKRNATIFMNSTPAAYGQWLEATLRQERASAVPAAQKMVFVNAWNEWAEGNHLEPCQRWGRAYLEEHAAARLRAGCPALPSVPTRQGASA